MWKNALFTLVTEGPCGTPVQNTPQDLQRQPYRWVGEQAGKGLRPLQQSICMGRAAVMFRTKHSRYEEATCRVH